MSDYTEDLWKVTQVGRKIGKAFAWLMAFSIVITVMGYLFPLVILGAVVLLIVAYKAPEKVARLSDNRYVERIPAAARATPMRFAVVIAAVLIPLAGTAGSAVYSPPQDDTEDIASLVELAAASEPMKTFEQSLTTEVISTPEATATPEATSTPEATVTPEPTNTPEPPTVTPEPTPTIAAPTATPIPTEIPPTATPTPVPPTATPETSAQEQAYVVEIERQLQHLGESFETVGGLFSDFSAANLLDEEWKVAFGVELGTWRALNELSLALTPPPGYEAFHAKWLEVTAKLDAASHDYANGFDNFDADLIMAGNTKINEATVLVNEASVLFEIARE